MKIAELLADEMATMYAWMREHGADAKTRCGMFIDCKNRFGQLNRTKDGEKWAGSSNYPVYSEATDIYCLEAWLTERFAYPSNCTAMTLKLLSKQHSTFLRGGTFYRTGL